MFHNEALQQLDVVVAAAVEGPPLATPPASPAAGNCYIVASGATGAWAGHAQQLAAYSAGGWRFVAPLDGMSAYDRGSGATAVFDNGAWVIGTLTGSQLMLDGLKVVGARAAAIAAPAAGTIVDVEARAAIGQMLTMLRQHGLIAN